MMVPDEVDMEHEVVKCGMCIVKEMNVVKGEKDLLRKEVGELRKEIGELKKEVGELRVQTITKDKEVDDVKAKEENSWAIPSKQWGTKPLRLVYILLPFSRQRIYSMAM